MTSTLLIFGAIPGIFALVGLVFACVFGPGVVRRFFARSAAERSRDIKLYPELWKNNSWRISPSPVEKARATRAKEQEYAVY